VLTKDQDDRDTILHGIEKSLHSSLRFILVHSWSVGAFLILSTTSSSTKEMLREGLHVNMGETYALVITTSLSTYAPEPLFLSIITA
jgi:hypothetical protein